MTPLTGPAFCPDQSPSHNSPTFLCPSLPPPIIFPYFLLYRQVPSASASPPLLMFLFKGVTSSMFNHLSGPTLCDLPTSPPSSPNIALLLYLSVRVPFSLATSPVCLCPSTLCWVLTLPITPHSFVVIYFRLCLTLISPIICFSFIPPTPPV